MMSDGTKAACTVTAILLVIASGVSLVSWKGKVDERWRREQFEKEAIQHGAGTYDSETGKFKWKY